MDIHAALLHCTLLSMILVISLCTSTDCPERCQCGLDDSDRQRVMCINGGLTDPIPIRHMNSQTQVIVLSAPESNCNSLTIGPIFQQFKRLERLKIEHSKVPAVGVHSFWGVPSMQHLELPHNHISEVSEASFRGLANLIVLDLSYNRLEALVSGTFRHLTELRELSLAHNRLTALAPRLFLYLGKLRQLDLSGNLLRELSPEVFKDVPELRALRCRACGLRSINTQIYYLLPQLNLLDFGDNEFKYMPADEFAELRKLKFLWLDGNQLPVVLERTFATQTQLLTLSLARNRLAKITAQAFVNLTSLQNLDISYNKLHHIEAMSFYPLSDSLRSLNVSGNNLPVEELKYVLQVLPKLKELAMADLSLTDIPFGFFSYLNSLQKLNLSRNSFDHFPIQILTPTAHLNELDLSSNLFRGFNDRVIIKLEKINILHLENNSWSCDLCHIVSLISYLEKRPDNKYLSNLVCNTPPYLNGKKLNTLTMKDIEWCDSEGVGYTDSSASISNTFLEEGNLTKIAIVLGIVIILIAIFVLCIGVCYSKRRAANLYTNEEEEKKKKQKGPEDITMFDKQTVIPADAINGEISFKFPLDICQTTNKVSVSTIDELTMDPQLLQTRT